MNEAAHTVVVVTARKVPLAWTDVEQLFSWAWELYVIFWWKEQGLLFINGSTNAGEFKTLAQSVAGQDVELIRGQQVFRAFSGINRLRLNNVGLTERLGRNVSFTSRMGADVAAGLHDAQRRRASKSNLAGAGFEGGASGDDRRVPKGTNLVSPARPRRPAGRVVQANRHQASRPVDRSRSRFAWHPGNSHRHGAP